MSCNFLKPLETPKCIFRIKTLIPFKGHVPGVIPANILRRVY